MPDSCRAPGSSTENVLGAVGGQIDFVLATVTKGCGGTDIVVTEFGAAHPWSRSLAERAKQLIAVAHPDFREQLARQAHDVAGIRDALVPPQE